MTANVTVVDYGVGNLLSVRGALEHCGATINFCSEPDKIRSSDRLLLPGVGAFSDAMDDMENASLIDPVLEFASTGKPIIGICLGLQMLFSNSSEHGQRDGLGLIEGEVVEIPRTGTNNVAHRIPHIGWNELREGNKGWAGTVLENIDLGASVYFAHSYMGRPNDPNIKIADCDYNGITILATLQAGNIHGCQFHPEKSGLVGLKVIENFLGI
jgi:imidazole glycerol-phosphate synthase subunit HisH